MLDEDYNDWLEMEGTAQLQTWEAHLPWLTEAERHGAVLKTHPNYPKDENDFSSLKNFAHILLQSCSRFVPCLFDMNGARLRGVFDLVRGGCYFRDNGSQTLAEELPSCVHAQLGDPKVATLHFVEVCDGFANMEHVPFSEDEFRPTGTGHDNVMASRVSATSLAYAVETLAKAGQLPAVTASFNGKRLGTFHPVA